jgi:hypothetical protein
MTECVCLCDAHDMTIPHGSCVLLAMGMVHNEGSFVPMRTSTELLDKGTLSMSIHSLPIHRHLSVLLRLSAALPNCLYKIPRIRNPPKELLDVEQTRLTSSTDIRQLHTSQNTQHGL